MEFLLESNWPWNYFHSNTIPITLNPPMYNNRSCCFYSWFLIFSIYFSIIYILIFPNNIGSEFLKGRKYQLDKNMISQYGVWTSKILIYILNLIFICWFFWWYNFWIEILYWVKFFFLAINPFIFYLFTVQSNLLHYYFLKDLISYSWWAAVATRK